MKLSFKLDFLSKFVISLALILWYLHLLSNERGRFNDDAFVGSAQLFSAVLTFNFISGLYSQSLNVFVFRVFSNNVGIYGWFRVLLYFLSLFLFAFLVVQVADKITVSSWDTVNGEVIDRFTDNIVKIEEDRDRFSHAMLHPVTKGKEDPRIFHQLFRYPMEDVKMKCTTRLPWISGGSLYHDQIIWHRNGVPVEFTDRHFQKVELREVPEDTSLLNKVLRENGISVYEINATLIIHLLKESEFGSYTCHVARSVKASVVDHVNKQYAAKKRNQTTAAKAEPDEESPVEEEVDDGGKEYCKCTHQPDLRYLFQDLYTWKGEFRLIPLAKRREILRLPPGSILSFTTSYWHLSRAEDVEIDYSVNEDSFLQLCPGLFHGCSKILLTYWLLGHDTGGFFGIPPLELFWIWKNPSFPAKRFEQVHCLCENSYGFHTVRYHRRYYNRTTERYELIEIPHPHELVVIPREQDMLNVFVNRSTGKYNPGSVMKSTAPNPCYSGSLFDEMSLAKEFAVVAVNYFEREELIFFAVVASLGLLILWNTRRWLRFMGRLFRLLVLEGSFAFFSTAVLSTRIQQRAAAAADETALVSYDVFLSHSDAEGDVKVVVKEVTPFLEGQGFKVCLRDRDLPAERQELPGLSSAIDRSKKVIFFLSSAYFQERFRRDFEAAIILEALCDRPAEPDLVLLVKLDGCNIPSWLGQFPAHDWSSNLNARENCLKLLRWLVSGDRRALLSVFDGFMTLLPLLFVCGSLLICSSTTLLFEQLSALFI